MVLYSSSFLSFFQPSLIIIIFPFPLLFFTKGSSLQLPSNKKLYETTSTHNLKMNSICKICVFYEYVHDWSSHLSRTFIQIKLCNPWCITQQKYSNNIWTSILSVGRRGLFHYLVIKIQVTSDGILSVPGFDILIFLDGVCSSMTFKMTVICYKQWCLVSCLTPMLENYPLLIIRDFIFSIPLIVKLSFPANSEVLKQILQNPHLQEVLVSVDNSPNPEYTMQLAMQGPLFVEFADECLRVIEPMQTVPT